jgi:predicted O-methyltransferase YrrM
MKETILNLYNEFVATETIQLEMQKKIIEYLFNNNVEGDILEIGALEGSTTVAFLEVAKKYKRKVYVIDPYNGNQEGNDQIFETFKKRTKGYDNLVFLKEPSQSDMAISLMENSKFAYSFIDGLHNYYALISDISASFLSTSIGGVLCVDDTEMPGLIDSVNMCLSKFNNLELIVKPDNNVIGEFKYGRFNPPHKKFEFLIKNIENNV